MGYSVADLVKFPPPWHLIFTPHPSNPLRHARGIDFKTLHFKSCKMHTLKSPCASEANQGWSYHATVERELDRDTDELVKC